MQKRDKIKLLIIGVFIIITILTKFSMYLNDFSFNPITHHSLTDAKKCAEKVILNSKIYNYEIKVNCNCEIVSNGDYYKYTCECPIKKKANNELLQSGGSRILYEEKKTYKLKYNFWLNENNWYTGYCD
jgi:hypothetical protein